MPKLTLFLQGRPLDSFPLEQGVSIGSSPDSEITLEGTAVSKNHAQVFSRDGGWLICSKSDKDPVLVNHSPIQEQQLLHGDHIQIGKYCLSFSEDAAQLDISPVDPETIPLYSNETDQSLDQAVRLLKSLPNGCIQIQNGPHIGKIIPLQKSLTRLGLNGNHCAMIAHRRDGYYLSHLEGDNPPKVDRRAIGNHSIPLKDGQIIELGKTRMRFYEEIMHPAVI